MGEPREVDCPRCFEQCGWCGDYRYMHGTMRLPGVRGRKNTHCDIPAMAPEGDNCPLCHGSRRMIQTITYAPVSEPPQ